MLFDHPIATHTIRQEKNLIRAQFMEPLNPDFLFFCQRRNLFSIFTDAMEIDSTIEHTGCLTMS